MAAIAYTVVATLPGEDVASEYIGWLESGHLDAVLEAGAANAMIVRIQDPPAPIQVETRYVFPTREVFERYLREAAPALRAEGQARFPPHRGVTFTRRIGVVL
jgi:hypothetical protein